MQYFTGNEWLFFIEEQNSKRSKLHASKLLLKPPLSSLEECDANKGLMWTQYVVKDRFDINPYHHFKLNHAGTTATHRSPCIPQGGEFPHPGIYREYIPRNIYVCVCERRIPTAIQVYTEYIPRNMCVCKCSLEIMSSIPAGSTIIYRFLRGFICVSLCQSIKIKPTNIYSQVPL